MRAMSDVLRLVYIQSHDHVVIGTIPVGATDDVDDEGGISESSDVCCQTADPASHTPVRKNATLSADRCHPQIRW